MATNKIILICDVCKSRNYTFFSGSTTKRLELNKYCTTCTKHTMHKQSR